jgi:2-polyprenyl-3-methyl-5-hydroxy-6-metoxy-1,4-benzoquinol methylase
MASPYPDPVYSEFQLGANKTVMSEENSPNNLSIFPDEYSPEYFKTCCDGFDEYHKTGGAYLPRRLERSASFVDLIQGLTVLDIGCGRGELLRHSAAKGTLVWGLDYAPAAIDIAQHTLSLISSPSVRQRIGLLQGNAIQLPFSKGSFDVVFMTDIVEHLNPDELYQVLKQMIKILKKEGILIIHTMPNLWYYRIGYPIFRLFQRFRGIKLPRDPRDRWEYKHVHINEQTPDKLRRILKQSGLSAKVWLESTQTYDQENSLTKLVMKLMTRTLPFRWFFCNEIFAIARLSK